jgi:hypothetical protein
MKIVRLSIATLIVFAVRRSSDASQVSFEVERIKGRLFNSSLSLSPSYSVQLVTDLSLDRTLPVPSVTFTFTST